MAKRRWRRASWLAIALTFIGIVVSVRLGVWQLDRAGQAQALLDAFAGAATATPEDFSTVNTNPPADRFPKVRVRGHFLADRGWWRDEQLNGGRVGVEAYAAFAADGSDALLLVDRGWSAWSHVPGTQPSMPAAPQGEVELTGMYAPFPASGLRLGGSVLPKQSAWPKLTLAIDREEIAADLGRPLLPRVLLLDADAASGFERTWTPALMPPERHRAYAFQWFAFALAALVAFVVLHWKKVDS
jgi:cytochrome oxidase assembly protein ShyY1